MYRVYLAGPDVFFANALEVGARKQAICAQYGLSGHFPLDNQVPAAGSPWETAMAIYRANRDLMLSCDAGLFNVTPYRGVSADVGTVFELGFFRGLGRPGIGYSQDRRAFSQRVVGALDGPPQHHDGRLTDSAGLEIENFGCADNLMIDGCLAELGEALLFSDEGVSGDVTKVDYALFERAVAALAKRLGVTPTAGS